MEDEQSIRAEVAAVGRGEVLPNPDQEYCRGPIDVENRDVVRFLARDAKSILLDNQDYFVLDQHDILVVETEV